MGLWGGRRCWGQVGIAHSDWRETAGHSRANARYESLRGGPDATPALAYQRKKFTAGQHRTEQRAFSSDDLVLGALPWLCHSFGMGGFSGAAPPDDCPALLAIPDASPPTGQCAPP